MNYNRATVIGRVAHTPELKKLPSGVSVCSMSVATNYSYKDQSGSKVEKTDWHNVIAYGKLAETLAQYVEGGQEMLFEGRMQTQSWQKDGEDTKRYRTEIIIDTFQFGQRSQARAERKQEEQSHNQETSDNFDGIDYPTDDINPDDIPF